MILEFLDRLSEKLDDLSLSDWGFVAPELDVLYAMAERFEHGEPIDHERARKIWGIIEPIFPRSAFVEFRGNLALRRRLQEFLGIARPVKKS